MTRRFGMQPQQGMAIALVLWMVAGMALTVSAIVHYGSSDLTMTELRVRQAQADALGRGFALLAVRDFLVSQKRNATNSEPELPAAQLRNTAKLEYRVAGVEIEVAVLPANSLVSLNSASEATLRQLFHAVGGAEAELAGRLADAVVQYRDPSPSVSFKTLYRSGFRYREELLSVPGMRRDIYDRVRQYVHAFGGGDINIALAPAVLSSALLGGAGLGDSAKGGGSEDGQGDGEGALTFDNMYSRAGRGGRAPHLVDLKFLFPDGARYRQNIWVSRDGEELALVREPERYRSI